MSQYRLKIEPDNEYSGPREDCECLGIMACWWGNSSLGDSNAMELLLDEICKTHPNFSYTDPRELMVACENAGMIMLPVYAYDHGGITVSTTPFSCRFDSGQAGFIAAPKSRVREFYGCKRITANVLRKVFASLKVQVEEYDTYLIDGGTGYVLEKLVDGGWENEHSCWGFNGTEYETNGILDDVNGYVGNNDSLSIRRPHQEDYQCFDMNEQMLQAA